MKFSVFTVIMGEYATADVAAELASLGYDGVEWRIHEDFHVHPDQFEEQAPRLNSLATEHGLAAPALGTYIKVHEAAQLESCCRAAVVMGCPNIRLAMQQIYDGRRAFDELFREAHEDLAQAGTILNKHNLRGLLEIHHGTIAESASGMRRLLDKFSPETFGAIFDPGNMIAAGRESWRLGIDILGPYLTHVHVKNLSWHRQSDHWVCGCDTLEDGMVDWPEVISALVDSGYTGWLSLEDLYGVNLDTTGLVGEQLPSEVTASVSIKQKLIDDLGFLRRYVEGSFRS